MQKISFENHFSARVVEILFPDGYTIASENDIVFLKSEWTKNLKSWHSPYTCLFDIGKLSISPESIPSLEKIFKFFNNFHMRKIVGFCEESSVFPQFSFETIVGYEKACVQVGLKKTNTLKRDLENLRSRILIENDFNAHVMEIQFLADTEFNSKDDILILKDKVKNILRLWHTPYSLLINCVNCTFSQESHEEYKKMEKFLKSFFCKRVIGYAPKISKELYPFETFRSRHLAAAQLEHEGLQSGNVANCSTKK